jgi:hypothetical protein
LGSILFNCRLGSGYIPAALPTARAKRGDLAAGAVFMDLLNTYERLGTQEIEEYIRLEQEEHLHLDLKRLKTQISANGTTEKILRYVSQGLPTQTGDSSSGGFTREKTNK